MNKTLTPAPIDEKNIITDFVDCDIFANHYMPTPDHKGFTKDLIGFRDGKLLEAKWTSGSNTMAFHFIDLPERSVRESDKTSLIDFLKGLEDCNEGITVEVWENGGWILCSFYFKEE